jgi:queuine tRNA-ribosyltransferase
MPPLTFQISHRAPGNRARLGRIQTLHGNIDTPAFMPVGTQGTIKGILPHMVRDIGAHIILANTFHLMLRPGSDLVAEMGGKEGLHAWMQWPGPILTDSGGFQVFSLADLNQINDDGVTFRSPHDGRSVHLTPERSIQVQNQLGADIIMAFDDCPPAENGESSEFGVPGSALEEIKAGSPHSAVPNPEPGTRNPSLRVRQATERSIGWLSRCVAAHARPDEQALFGIVQGGTDLDLRSWCARAVTQHELPGYAIGGVAVGEGYDELKRVVEHTAPLLPDDKPRYLMGVGYERDILTAVQAGVDMFDCVLPTRNGRNANAFTRNGQMRLKNAKYTKDPRPIDETCDCPACAGFVQATIGTGLPSTESRCFSRSYLRHLFMAGEMLGPILVTLHNLRHFQRFMLDIRQAIVDDGWSSLLRCWPVAVGRMKHDL